MQLTQCHDAQQWDVLQAKSGAHPLQYWGWGELKAVHNWRVVRLIATTKDSATQSAQVLIRPLPWPFRALAYIPRGNQSVESLDAIADYVKQHYGACVIQIEPATQTVALSRQWKKTDRTILIPSTLQLDLHRSPDELLAKMAKKTRQYIRKSRKEPIEIRPVRSDEELNACLAIYEQTAQRAGFALHGRDYYEDLFRLMPQNTSLLAAFHVKSPDTPLAFLWSVYSPAAAFELYGGVSDEGQRLRVNYALKWQAIRQLQADGVRFYDMNGLLNDGISQFKRSFAQHETMLAGTYQRSLHWSGPLWSTFLPLLKKIRRLLP